MKKTLILEGYEMTAPDSYDYVYKTVTVDVPDSCANYRVIGEAQEVQPDGEK